MIEAAYFAGSFSQPRGIFILGSYLGYWIGSLIFGRLLFGLQFSY